MWVNEYFAWEQIRECSTFVEVQAKAIEWNSYSKFHICTLGLAFVVGKLEVQVPWNEWFAGRRKRIRYEKVLKMPILNEINRYKKKTE